MPTLFSRAFSTTLFFGLLLALLLALVSPLLQAASVRSNHSSIELVAEVASVAPGQSFTVGLDVTPDPHWHHYWVNPGDAGKGMEVKWDLPPGFTVGEITYPTPDVVPFAGLISYGYSEPNTLLLSMTAPTDITGEVQLSGMASWLVCDDKSCVPERAPVNLTLPVGSGDVDIGNAGLFKFARQSQPKAADWPASFSQQGEQLTFEVAFPVADAKDIYLFPAATKLTDAGAGQQAELQPGLLTVTAKAASRAERVTESDLVVVYHDVAGSKQSMLLQGVERTASAGSVVAANLSDDSTAPINGEELGFWVALGFAFVGGLILNLMPCVLPVLSLKVLSLVKTAEQHPSWVRESGLFYTGGVLLSFAIMAGVVIAIQQSGQAIGWGFQLQNPMVVLSLSLLMVLIGLNLFGVFEFGSGLMNAGSSLTEGRSNRASFWTGVLAVLVATPCTAPFMAGALGYAFVQPWYVSLSVFLMLGLGLAFPYLLIAFVPGAQRIVPKPGPWMNVFKTALAFPMLATAIWLIWTLGDGDAMLYALVTALVVAIAAWAWGQRQSNGKPVVWRIVALLAAIVAFFPASETLNAKAAAVAARQAAASNEVNDQQSGEQRYSDQLVQQRLAEGQAVFAYFTADWCITCKANERASLKTDEVQSYFVANNIAVLVGDYTDYDAEITQVLQRYRRAGVPLYLYYQPGNGLADAKVLPQTLLSPSAIIDELAVN